MQNSIILFITAVICLFILSLFAAAFFYNVMLKIKRGALHDLYSERLYLLQQIIHITKKTYSADSELIISFTNAIEKAERANAPGDIEAAYKSLNTEYAKLNGSIKKYPILHDNERFAALAGELMKNEEKTAFARQFYNEAVGVFNKKVFRYPVKAAASVLGYKKQKPVM